MFHDSQTVIFLWGAIFLGTAYSFYRVGLSYLNWKFPLENRTAESDSGLGLWFDPVCGETLGVDGGVYWVKTGGRTYGFCSKECRDTFVRNSDLVLNYRETSGRRLVS